MRLQPGRISMAQHNWLAANARPVTLPTIAALERMEEPMAHDDGGDLTRSQFLKLIGAAVEADAEIAATRTAANIALARAVKKSSARLPMVNLARRFARQNAKDSDQCREDLRQFLLFMGFLGIEPAEAPAGIEEAEAA